MDLSLSLLVIRFAAGMLVMGHGAQKLVGVGGGPGIRKWATMIGTMGFRPVAGDYLSESAVVRHDPNKLSQAIVRLVTHRAR